MLFNKLFGDKNTPKSRDKTLPLNSERAISPWEAQNEETIDELANFIDFAEGFTIGFVEVSFPEDIENLLKLLRLRPECRNVEFHVFDFSDPNLTYLKDELIQRISQLPQPFSALMTPKRVILVKGLENSIGIIGDYPPVLQDLNFVRDALADSVQYPVLFCLPSYAINRVMKYAPDFWSWTSGVFRILANQDQQDEASIYALHAQKMLGSTSQLEKQERIKRLEKLAQEFDPLESNRSKEDLRISAESLMELGNIYISSGEYPKAQTCLNKISPIFEKLYWQSETQQDLTTRIKYLNWSGYLNYVLGNHVQAELLLGQASSLNKGVDQDLKAFTLYLQGMLKAHQNREEEALDFFQKVLKYENCFGDTQRKASTLNQIGKIKQSQKKMDQALSFFKNALEIDERIQSLSGMAANLHDIGTLKVSLGEVEEAYVFYERALEISNHIGNAFGRAETLWHYGELLADQKSDFATAISYLQEALEIFHRIGSPGAEGVQATLKRVQSKADKQ
jgi:tetratricopeptide (TPR) repeat protein